MDPRSGGSVHRGPYCFFAGLAQDVVEWAEHEFALDKANDAGVTERDHLEEALRKAKTPKRIREIEDQLYGPEFPDECVYLLEWFNEVGPSLSGGMGPAPLTFEEIRAWSVLRKVEVSAWDAGMLRRMSSVYCNIQNKKAS